MADIEAFHAHLTQQGIRTVIWNDMCYLNRNVHAQVFADKSLAAAPRLPRDIIHMLWDYDIAQEGYTAQLKEWGFDVWVAPGTEPDIITGWRRIVEEEGGDGLVLTPWVKLDAQSAPDLITQVRTLAPAYRGD